VPRERFSASEARRIALAAQGFGRDRSGPVSPTDFKKLTRRLGVLQMDSVNVLVRSHYLPAFSRLGAYAPALLDTAAYNGRRRHLFEYWGHEASLLPVELYKYFRWRMTAAEQLERVWGNIARTKRERADLVDRVFQQVEARGPIASSDLEGPRERSGPWWGWSEGKLALEYLFWSGAITTAGRRNFERVYDLPERVLPQAALDGPVPDRADAQRELMRLAIRALGIATEPDLRDYFRLSPADSKARLAELVEEGAILPVSVDGWAAQAYLDPNARLPRRIDAQCLVSPFDSLIWERSRTERLWGFRFRLEFYVPGPKRVHGYYVMPFLLDDRLVGRVDLKADRATGTLKVLAAFGEPGIDANEVAAALYETSRELAAWLGLSSIAVFPQGDLAETLRRTHSAPTMTDA
jgi:uncharacterized protein YcaQ